MATIQFMLPMRLAATRFNMLVPPDKCWNTSSEMKGLPPLREPNLLKDVNKPQPLVFGHLLTAACRRSRGVEVKVGLCRKLF